MEQYSDLPMIVRSTEAGGFLRANRSFLDAVGYTQTELAQSSFIDWIVEEDRQAFLDANDGGDGHCRVRHRTSSGTPLALDLMVRDQGGGPVVLARDVSCCPSEAEDTEVGAEVTVKSTLHKIARIVEEQNPGYKCSILLVAHGRFVKGAGPSLPDDYNDAIDGFAVGPTVGSCGTAIYWNVPVIVEDIQKDPLWTPFAELAMKAGVAACWSHPFSTKGGRVLGALALYSPEPAAPTQDQLNTLRAAAQMTGLAVERGRAEEELRSANEVKSRFMANMSHEIRTPLNALIGITDSLQEVDDIDLRDDVRHLRDAGEQLLELFTGVLELTEVPDRRGHDKVVDLPDSCRQVCESLETAAQARGLSLECVISENVPRWISLDAWAFERALKLLINNALKFTDDGTVIVAVEYTNRKLQARISDTGCGIDLDRLNELRQPFVQGDLSTTKQYGGFGLGLALCDLCVHALGGKLQFESNEPQGTTVRFSIPVALAGAPVETEQRPMPTDLEPASLPVLVVEDNPLNCAVIGRILERSGYACHFSENGSEALTALRQNAYCCVLMDCQMPVMDGYEATRRIRQLEEETGGHIPIIAVTANSMAEDRDLCLQAGMDEYLSKPVRRDELIVKLREFVGRSSAVQAIQ